MILSTKFLFSMQFNLFILPNIIEGIISSSSLFYNFLLYLIYIHSKHLRFLVFHDSSFIFLAVFLFSILTFEFNSDDDILRAFLSKIVSSFTLQMSLASLLISLLQTFFFLKVFFACLKFHHSKHILCDNISTDQTRGVEI